MDTAQRRWSGPLPRALEPFTSTREMTLSFREGWPYQPPFLEVTGIDGWHADHGHPCLWQEGDASLLWQSFDGLLARIDEWVSSRNQGFGALGAALDAWVYFDTPWSGLTISIDMERLSAGGMPRPDQSGNFSIEQDGKTPLVRAIGGWLPGAARRGRWFAIAPPAAPPTNLDGVLALLASASQRQVRRELALLAAGKPAWSTLGLVWTGPYGPELVFMTLDPGADGRVTARTMRPTPDGLGARLRRAGPDADLLRTKRVALFGAGSIGSHLAVNLASSGCGFLRLVDSDTLLPVNLARHAANAGAVGYPKAVGVGELLRARSPWLTVEPVIESPWAPNRLRELIADVDLVLDATGNDAFAMNLSRVSAGAGKTLISTALYRGGRIARMRRQRLGDAPLASRGRHWRYPTIPSGDEHDYVGLEVGCGAPVTNAPPTAAVTAGALCADMVIDLLCGRPTDDELIVVMHPLADQPFDRVGRVLLDEMPAAAYITQTARGEILTQSAAAFPNETGGILVGVMTATGEPWILHAIEVPAVRPSPMGYQVPSGRTQGVIDMARVDDDRVGYLGEWHSHPNSSERSAKDIRTMQDLAQNEALAGHRPTLIVARREGDTYGLSASIASESSVGDVELRAAGPLPGGDPSNEFQG